MVIPEILATIIINAGIAHGFLITILFSKHKDQHAGFLLSLLLIDLSLIVFRIQYLTPYLVDNLGYSFFGSGPFIFLLGPFLFFYLRSIVIPGATITKKDFVHFIFFILFLVLVAFQFLLRNEGVHPLIFNRIIGSPWIFLVLQFGYYLVQSHHLLRMHKANIVAKYSNVEGMDASWLNLIIWLFILILVFIAIATPWLIHGMDLKSYYKAGAVFFSLILFFTAYKGIQQRIPKEPFPGIEKEQDASDMDTIVRLKEKLILHIKGTKPFLNPELTLIDLARQLAIGRNQLSQVINTGVGDNFYNFINKFRVEEVKELIKKDVKRQYTILSLARDAGFNSKSSFNKIFKKTTGLTPSEYRDAQR